HSFPFSLDDDLDPLDLHSFPTRRSSDLGNVNPLRDLLCNQLFDRQGFTHLGLDVVGRHLLILQALLKLLLGVLALEVGKLRIDLDRKSTRLNSSHSQTSYAVFCLKKKNT